MMKVDVDFWQDFRPANAAKRKFKATLKRLTKRNRPGTFPQIIKEINQVTGGVD